MDVITAFTVKFSNGSYLLPLLLKNVYIWVC